MNSILLGATITATSSDHDSRDAFFFQFEAAEAIAMLSDQLPLGVVGFTRFVWLMVHPERADGA